MKKINEFIIKNWALLLFIMFFIITLVCLVIVGLSLEEIPQETIETEPGTWVTTEGHYDINLGATILLIISSIFMAIFGLIYLFKGDNINEEDNG